LFLAHFQKAWNGFTSSCIVFNACITLNIWKQTGRFCKTSGKSAATSFFLEPQTQQMVQLLECLMMPTTVMTMNADADKMSQDSQFFA
jgi:hypothetical protein